LERDDIKDLLSPLKFWNWQSAYRSFEILQDLPFDKINSCDCSGICCDGTMQCIRLKQLHIRPLDSEQLPRKSISFKNHTLIESHTLREKLTRSHAFDFFFSARLYQHFAALFFSLFATDWLHQMG
jgi:hypothetical protein